MIIVLSWRPVHPIIIYYEALLPNILCKCMEMFNLLERLAQLNSINAPVLMFNNDKFFYVTVCLIAPPPPHPHSVLGLTTKHN